MAAYIAELLFIGISTGALYAIVAIGFNLVFGTMNVLNLAHGAILMIGSYGLLLAYYLGLDNFWLAASVGILIAVATGLLIERLTVRPLRGHWWNTKVATLGAAVFLENLVQVLTNGHAQNVPRPFEPTYYRIFADIELSDFQIFLVVVSVGTMSAMAYFLTRTRWGRAIRVLAQSPDIAKSVGIDVDRTIVLGFGRRWRACGCGGHP